MKLKPTKRHYSAEFKLEAVQQVVLHQQRLCKVNLTNENMAIT